MTRVLKINTYVYQLSRFHVDDTLTESALCTNIQDPGRTFGPGWLKFLLLHSHCSRNMPQNCGMWKILRKTLKFFIYMCNLGACRLWARLRLGFSCIWHFVFFCFFGGRRPTKPTPK